MYMRTFHRFEDSDFEFMVFSEGLPASVEDRIGSRVEQVECDARTAPGWRGQNLREDQRVSLEPEFTRASRGSVSLSFRGRTLDRPADLFLVQAKLPIAFVLDLPSPEAQLVKMVRTYEALAACFCRWRGWSTPGPLPLTTAEQHWVDANGEPELPAWIHSMRVPRPRRSDTTPTSEILQKIGNDGDLETRAERAVEAISDQPKSSVRAIIRGWYSALADLNTRDHREHVERRSGRMMDDTTFLALRIRAMLIDPGRAIGATPATFAEMNTAWTDFDDLDEATAFAGSIIELADFHDVNVGLLALDAG